MSSQKIKTNYAFYTAVILLQIIMILLVLILINPSQQLEEYRKDRVISKVEEATSVNQNEEPTVAVVADADYLREENNIQSEVYKDAQDGDYVLIYSDKIIIYRSDSEKIVYEGPSPSVLLSENQRKFQEDIKEKISSAGIVTTDEEPQLSVIVDVEETKSQNPQFYANVQEQDIIAYFPKANKIVLYRPSTKEIINSANLQFNIT